MKQRALFFAAITATLGAAGCGARSFLDEGATGGGGSGGGGAATGASSQGGGGAPTTTTTGGTTTTGTTTTSTGSTTTTSQPCEPGGATDDMDGDGYAPIDGDCDECDPEVNPNAVEVPDNGVDDDCNGQLDEPLPTCDADIALDTLLPEEVARAVELCKVSDEGKTWGLVQAVWTLPDGTPPPNTALEAYHLGHGVLPDFGPNNPPHAGKKLVALSSGTARRPGDPGFDVSMGFNKGFGSEPPDGFPKDSPACPGVSAGPPFDGVALQVEIRVPSNGHGFGFDFNFHSAEFPGLVCSQYDDSFFALLSPTLPGLPDGHIAFDDLGNPVTVNHANFRVCGCAGGPPCIGGGKLFTCELGTAGLMGTGFGPSNGTDGAGATGWLTTLAPAEPNSLITLRWGVYDAADGNATTTTLLDSWRWITSEGMVQPGDPQPEPGP